MPQIMIRKGSEHLFLTFQNHFENRPSTILNFLEHLRMSRMCLSFLACECVWVSVCLCLGSDWTLSWRSWWCAFGGRWSHNGSLTGTTFIVQTTVVFDYLHQTQTRPIRNIEKRPQYSRGPINRNTSDFYFYFSCPKNSKYIETTYVFNLPKS